MAQTQIVSEDRATQLVTRWMGELEAFQAAGDTARLEEWRDRYAIIAAEFVATGSLAAAERFAALSLRARDLLALPRPQRELRRHPKVTEALMERDV